MGKRKTREIREGNGKFLVRQLQTTSSTFLSANNTRILFFRNKLVLFWLKKMMIMMRGLHKRTIYTHNVCSFDSIITVMYFSLREKKRIIFSGSYRMRECVRVIEDCFILPYYILFPFYPSFQSEEGKKYHQSIVAIRTLRCIMTCRLSMQTSSPFFVVFSSLCW